MDGGGGTREKGEVVRSETHMAPYCLTWFGVTGNIILWRNIYLMTIDDGI